MNKQIVYRNIIKDGKVLVSIRRAHVEGMQEFLCPDGKKVYEKQEERFKQMEENLKNCKLSPEHEILIQNKKFVDMLNYEHSKEYKYRHFYKILTFLKIIK